MIKVVKFGGSSVANAAQFKKVKKIIERSISFVEPFFTIRNGEIHHEVRINKKIKFKVYFYGENITEEDKKTATRFVEANMNNLNTNYPEIYFYNDYKEINIWNYI